MVPSEAVTTAITDGSIVTEAGPFGGQPTAQVLIAKVLSAIDELHAKGLSKATLLLRPPKPTLKPSLVSA